MEKPVLFIYNPGAGKGKIKSSLSDVLVVLSAMGRPIVVHPTAAVRDATHYIATQGANYSLIVCSGGDGTFSECINGLLELPKESRPGLGYLPTGTTNDCAASLKLSTNPIEAAKNAVFGKPFSMDVGKLNNRYFTYVAAFGAFTNVSYDTPQNLKNTLGQLAYVVNGAMQLPNLRTHHVRVTFDGQVVEDDFIYGMISNSESVAGIKGLTGKDVFLHDGVFELTLVKEPKKLSDYADILTALTTVGHQSPLVTTAKVSRLHLHFDEPMSFTLDGEYGGHYTDVTVHTIPRAVNIIK